MAGYLEKLTADMKAAMKAREQDKLTVLRMIISDIKKKAEAEGELSDDAELAILQKAVKTRSDTIDQAKAAGRDEIAAREQLEIEMIEGYLPAQMSAEEVEAKVREVAAEIGFEGGKDRGRVMKEWMGRYKGLADGKAVQAALGKLC
ncbi:MAG: GatB/YqeY domain-containing protein [Planctomycetota bacterium]|nr:GatB/YqeY domain-containing protein [Planctomycetota bacterium]